MKKMKFENSKFRKCEILEILNFETKNRPASWVEKISIFENSNLKFLEFVKNYPASWAAKPAFLKIWNF